jgi:membrane protein DedA with SNARE-associated domain
MDISLAAIEQWFQMLVMTVPLPWFVFVGSALEEIFSIIPATIVMGIAGSAALIEGQGIFYLMGLAFLGSVARLFGAYLYYWLGDKLEDILVPYFKRFFGVGHEEIEGIGKRFNGKHFQDGFVLFAMRATPFFPVTITSIACGIIKMNMQVFILATFLGNFCKDFLYLFVGYVGLASLAQLWKSVQQYKVLVDDGVGMSIVALMVVLYLFRGQGKRLVRFFKEYQTWFRKN